MLFHFYFQQLWCGSDTLFCLFFQHCRLVQTAVPPNWLFVTSKYQTVFSLIQFFILISVTYCIGCRTVLSLTDNICVPLRVVAIFNAGMLCHHPTSSHLSTLQALHASVFDLAHPPLLLLLSTHFKAFLAQLHHITIFFPLNL